MTDVMQGCPHPRGRRAHLRAGGVGAALRLGRRGHQDRARRAGRRHARARRHRRRRRHGQRRAPAARALQPGQEEPRARPHVARRPRDPAPARSRRPTSSSPTSCRAWRRSCRSRSTRCARTTRRSSTCAATGRVRAAPTPTRAPTTRWRSGPAPAWRSAAPAPSTTSSSNPPAPGFGDSIGAMTIAGGIMGALFHRERTGEATIVDVSLLGTGLWAMGQAVALSLQMDIPWTAPPADQMRFNPLVAMYDTSDGRLISLCCLQAGQYWPPLCEAIGRPELADRRSVRRPRDVAREHSAEAAGDPARGVRDAHGRRVARARSPTSSGSGPSCSTRSRPPPIRSRWRTATSRTHHRGGHALPADRRAGPVRRGRRRSRAGRRSSTSTATRSSPSSVSTGMRSSTSRCAASSPDRSVARPRGGARTPFYRLAEPCSSRGDRWPRRKARSPACGWSSWPSGCSCRWRARCSPTGAPTWSASSDPRATRTAGLMTQGIGTDGGGGVNLSIALANRGKRSVALDLRTEGGREILEKLIATADVFLTNFRPGALQRLGLDAETLTERYPHADLRARPRLRRPRSRRRRAGLRRVGVLGARWPGARAHARRARPAHRPARRDG